MVDHKRIMFALVLAVTGILRAQSDETPEEIMSRYLGRIEVVDGTNILVQVRQWGGRVLVQCDGWTSYCPAETGEEKIVHCGERISYKYSGGPSLDVQLCTGVWDEDRHGLSVDGEGDLIVRIREGKRMDIFVLPKEGKTYDALAGEYIDLVLPFKNMWKDMVDMVRYWKRMEHRRFSRRILVRSVRDIEYMKNYLTTNNPPVESVGVSGVGIASLKLNSQVDMVASLSSDRKVNGILLKVNGVPLKAYTYSDRGHLGEYIEFDVSRKTLSAVVKYGEDGALLRSWHSSYNPQYVIVSNGVMVSSFEMNDCSNHLHSVVRHVNELFMVNGDTL